MSAETVVSMGNTVKVSYTTTESYDVDHVKSRLASHDHETETEGAVISSIWTRLLQWYFKNDEGYGVAQQVSSNNQAEKTSSDSTKCGTVVTVHQTYRLRWEGVPLRKWICFVHCADSSPNASPSELQKEQAEDISRRSGKDGAKFPSANGGYVWGIVALGKKARFYEYRHVGGGTFEASELAVGDSEGAEPFGAADIVEDAVKVHDALVRIKKRSAGKGM